MAFDDKDMMTTTRYVILIALVAVAGCQVWPFEIESSPREILAIRSGSSFGFCVGYCRLELDIDEERMALVEKGWDAQRFPDRYWDRPTTDEAWDELIALIDLEQFRRLDSVIGCPDCADGGAEWLEIQDRAGARRVTYEYGKSPDGIEAIADSLRALRTRLKEDAFGSQ